MARKHRGPKGLVGGQYRPLTDDQVSRIHEAALTILERTGVHVEEPEALRLFREAGAIVARDGPRVHACSCPGRSSRMPSTGPPRGSCLPGAIPGGIWIWGARGCTSARVARR